MSRTGVVERPPAPAAPSPGSAIAPGRRGIRPPSLTALTGLGLALIAWVVHLRPLLDNSFLWHLRTGHWILDHGIPRHDIFSFTSEGTPWVVQSWLAEVFYAAIDNAFGPFGLQMLRAGLAAGLTYGMFRLAVRLSGDRARALLVTVPSVGAGFLLWNERPLMLGAVAMLALVWAVEVPGSRVGRNPLVALPVLFWLWANVHGSFALGFVCLGVHLMGRWLDGSPPWAGREGRLAAGTGLALAACLANPMGVSLLTFPVRLLSRGQVLRELSEWQPPSPGGIHGLLFAAFALLVALALVRGRRLGRVTHRDTLLAVVFVGLGFWAARNLVIVPLVCLPIVARAFASTAERPDRRPARHRAVLGVLVMVAAGSAAGAAGRDHYDFGSYPVEAMQVVDDQGLLGGRLLTTDAWGGYVIHQYWPKQQVFIDDRFDMYPVTVIEDYLTLDAGRPGWATILDRRDIDVVVWKTSKPLAALLDDAAGWRRIHRDEVAAVWVRT